MDIYVDYNVERGSYVISATSGLENNKHSWVTTMIWLSAKQLIALLEQIKEAQQQRFDATFNNQEDKSYETDMA